MRTLSDSTASLTEGRSAGSLFTEETLAGAVVTVFDTSLPPDSATGRPPVRAEARIFRKTAAAAQAQETAARDRKTADRKTADRRAGTETAAKETRKDRTSSPLRAALVTGLIAAAAAVILKRYRNRQNETHT